MTAVRERPRAAPAVRRPTSWRPLLRPIGYWATSRLLVVVAMGVGNRMRGAGQSVWDALHLWDGNWYLSAAAGYDYPVVPAGVPTGQVNIAFFPLYPLLSRWVEALTPLSPLASAVAVAWLFGVVTIVALWFLVERISGAAAADRTAMLFSFFPGSVMLSFVYSEPVMLACAIGCMLALLSHRWVTAGALGALTTLARPNGIVIAACCAWAAAVAIHRSRDWAALAAPALAPLGMLGWFAWLWSRTGDPTIWMRVQREGWGERVDWGGYNLSEILIVARDFHGASFNQLLAVAGLLFSVVAGYLLWHWRPPAILSIYAAGIIGLALISFNLGARPRFVMTAFPLVAAVAWAVRGSAFQTLVAVSAGTTAMLAMVYVIPRLAVP